MSEATKLLEQYVLDNFYPESAYFDSINKMGVKAFGYRCNKILISTTCPKLGCMSVYIEGKSSIEEFYVKGNSSIGNLFYECAKIEENKCEADRLNRVRKFLKEL